MGDDYNLAIVYTAWGGHLELVRFFTEHDKIGSPTLLQNQILTAGAHHGHEEVVHVALDNRANPNFSEKKDCYWSPLMLVIAQGHAKIVQLLLARGANQELPVRKGTPLSLAARRGYKEIVQMLLKDSADINTQWANPVVAAACHR